MLHIFCGEEEKFIRAKPLQNLCNVVES